ncbi:unnamed protein product [Arabidopsis halleri]
MDKVTTILIACTVFLTLCLLIMHCVKSYIGISNSLVAGGSRDCGVDKGGGGSCDCDVSKGGGVSHDCGVGKGAGGNRDCGKSCDGDGHGRGDGCGSTPVVVVVVTVAMCND